MVIFTPVLASLETEENEDEPMDERPFYERWGFDEALVTQVSEWVGGLVVQRCFCLFAIATVSQQRCSANLISLS